MKTPSRRDFLKFLTNALFTLAGLLGLKGLARFFSFQPNSEPPTEFNLGDAYEIPFNGSVILLDIPAVIYNKNGKFIAYSLTCPHLGCTVEEDEGGGFACPCHGSLFTKDGLVIKGPANKPLRQLRVELLEDNSLMLYTR